MVRSRHRETSSFDLNYKAIQGNLILKNYQPDGDSVRFKADDPEDFVDLYRYHRLPPDKRDKPVQLRLEAIDAPETHYGIYAQPKGDSARDFFLKTVGFTGIHYADDGKTVTESSPDALPATILTKAFDPHGRPISYLFVGRASEELQDMEAVSADTKVIDKTINISLLREGLAYPLLYTSAPLLHRQHIRELAKNVRTEDRGIWPLDSSSMFKLENYSSITSPNGSLIFPKLFRRAIDFFKAVDKGFTGDIIHWLIEMDEKENDHVLVDERYELRLSDILEQYNRKVVLKMDLLELVFIER
jgi:hypothetical protein